MSGIAVLTCVLLGVVVAVANAGEQYTDKYDKLDVDTILTNERLLNNYKECLVAGDDGKCSQEGKALKKVLSEALHTDCMHCTEKQKMNSVKVIKHLIKNKPAIWEEVSQRYDPHGEYIKKHPDLHT